MREDLPAVQSASSVSTCRAKDLCACGKAKQAKSETCGDCRTEVGDANGNWTLGVPDDTKRIRHGASPEHRGRDGARTCSNTSWWRKAASEASRGGRDGPSHQRHPRRQPTENLELWTRPQPSGIRVSDAVTWARSIYDRYVDVGAPPMVLTVSPEHPWVFMKLPGRGTCGDSGGVSTG